MKIVLRETEASDFTDVVRLLNEGGLGGTWFTPSLLARLTSRNRGFYFVAEVAGEIAGTIFGSHDGGYHGYICKLAVDNRFKRRGIGRMLLERVKRSFAEAGIGWYIALVRKNNAQSIQLFASSGFRARDVFHVFESGEG
jgi:ribosomal protein S18 acetylase RimI-like enzyme